MVMDAKTVLADLGLSEGEIAVYLSLLKLGPVAVSKIKEDSGLHRTTIYDFVEKLLQKGLVSYVVRSNVKIYSAADPSKLKDFLGEKQNALEQVLPTLHSLAAVRKEDTRVEIYKGPEGLKTVILDCIRTGKETVGMGIDEELWKKALPIFTEQYQKLLKKHGMHERILTKVNPAYLFDQSNTEYRFMPAEFFSPMSTLIYGSKIQIVIWEPSLTVLVIENSKLAEAYRKHFEALWNQQSLIFHGEEEVKAVFGEMVKTLRRGQEYLAFGVPPLPKKWVAFFDRFGQQLEDKGVRSRVMIDERDTEMIAAQGKWHSTEIRAVPKEHMTPAEVDIYGDNVAIILWEKTPQAFVIHNKKIAASFKKYFELLWETVPVQRT